MFEMSSPESIEDVADWVELVIAYSSRPISKLELTRYIEAASGSEPDEAFISSVWQELSFRENKYLKPPFKVTNRTINPICEWEKEPEYIACLIFSVFGGTKDLSKTTKQFERVSAEAIKNYLSCKIKILGWPTNHRSSFRDQVKNLAIELNEEFGKSPSSQKKDDTVDVVAWKSFNDGRSNQVVILTQCAAGKNWSIKKGVCIERWKEYIHWACPPLYGFSIPMIIPQRQWHDECKEKGIMFDRIRIYNLINRSKVDKGFRTELQKWCKKQLKRLSD